MDRTKFGAIPSEYDPRDYSVKMARAVTFPDEYEQPDVDIYDQGSIGNCVMQALRSCPHTHYGKEFGGTFGYGYWRDDGYQGEGMHPNVACNGFVRDGIPPTSVDKQWLEVPEAISYAHANKAAMLKAAEPYKSWTWARAYTVDEIKAALVAGNYVIVCLPYVGISNGRWLVDGRVVGYHEMRFLGWKKTGWKIRNSWGKGNSGSLSGTSDGYVMLNFEDAFACNDVIILFPPKKQDKPIIEPRRTLRVKSPYMTGADVTLCQRRLAVHGFTVSIDGIYGRMTAAAVTAFQKAQGLVADGICGAKTWAALDKEPSNGTDKTSRFVAWLKERVGDIYVWGGQGETDITEAWIRRRETSTANANKVIKLWKKRVAEGRSVAAYDCSGLITAWLLAEGLMPGDLSSRGLWRLCTAIKKAQLEPGDLVFRRNALGVIHHVGVYVGNGEVIEAKGRDDGVVRRGVNASGSGYWTDYGRLDCLK